MRTSALQHAGDPVDGCGHQRLLAVFGVASSVQDSDSLRAGREDSRRGHYVFALRGHWGTHYDRPSGPFTLTFWPTFLWFGFFEELIYWVSFTVAFGSLAGSIAAAVAKRRTREWQSAV